MPFLCFVSSFRKFSSQIANVCTKNSPQFIGKISERATEAAALCRSAKLSCSFKLGGTLSGSQRRFRCRCFHFVFRARNAQDACHDVSQFFFLFPFPSSFIFSFFFLSFSHFILFVCAKIRCATPHSTSRKRRKNKQ